MSSQRPNGSFSVLSMEISIFIICALIFLFAGIILLVKRFSHISLKIRSSSVQEQQRLLKKWLGYQVLTNGFNKTDTMLNHWFYILYTIRIGIPMIICSVLYKNPLAQVTLYLVFSFLILGYILKTKPLLRKINYIQLLVVETTVMVINLCLFILKICHLMTSQNTHQVAILGDVIIMANAVINFSNILFFFAKIINAYRVIRSSMTKDKNISKTVWLQLFVIYLQQGGMGFEEVFIDLETKRLFSTPDQVYRNEDGSQFDAKNSTQTDPMTLTETELLQSTFSQSSFQDFFEVPRIIKRSSQRRFNLDGSVHLPTSHRNKNKKKKMIL